MKNEERKLPLFDAPPVIETVLGVQFVPLKQFSIQHFGLFWSEIRASYPTFIPKPPLVPVVEEFEKKKVPKPPFSFSLSESSVDARGWYLDQSQTRLIQIQADRFIYNWKKVVGDEKYPQFDTIQPEFKSNWGKFCLFLERERISPPEINQCEMTYVNHIEIENGIKSSGEFEKVFEPWSGRFSGNFLPAPERIIVNLSFLMPHKKGRLHVSAQPAIRRQDGKEIIKLELTARGRPDNPSLNSILEWFDIGHEWIVRGFADLTTNSMHQFWRRKI